MAKINVPKIDVEMVVHEWWDYVKRGISSQSNSRMIMFSLYPNEYDVNNPIEWSIGFDHPADLDGLAKLVNAKTPNVFIEGACNPKTKVRLIEIYENMVGPSTPALPTYLTQHGITHNHFLLHINSNNRLDLDGKFRNLKSEDIIFFTDMDNNIHAYSLRMNKYLVNLRAIGEKIIRKVYTSINPATSDQIKIVYQSFVNSRI